MPLPNSSTFDSLINKATTLIEELANDVPFRNCKVATDEKKQHFRTDEEEPVPLNFSRKPRVQRLNSLFASIIPKRLIQFKAS
jgi:hypothetical protein